MVGVDKSEFVYDPVNGQYVHKSVAGRAGRAAGDELMTPAQVRAWLGPELYSVVCAGGRCCPLAAGPNGERRYLRHMVERGLRQYAGLDPNALSGPPPVVTKGYGRPVSAAQPAGGKPVSAAVQREFVRTMRLLEKALGRRLS